MPAERATVVAKLAANLTLALANQPQSAVAALMRDPDLTIVSGSFGEQIVARLQAEAEATNLSWNSDAEPGSPNTPDSPPPASGQPSQVDSAVPDDPGTEPPESEHSPEGIPAVPPRSDSGRITAEAAADPADPAEPEAHEDSWPESPPPAEAAGSETAPPLPPSPHLGQGAHADPGAADPADPATPGAHGDSSPQTSDPGFAAGQGPNPAAPTMSPPASSAPHPAVSGQPEQDSTAAPATEPSAADLAAMDAVNQSTVKGVRDGNKLRYQLNGPLFLIGADHEQALLDLLAQRERTSPTSRGSLIVHKGGMFDPGYLEIRDVPPAGREVVTDAVARFSRKEVVFSGG